MNAKLQLLSVLLAAIGDMTDAVAAIARDDFAVAEQKLVSVEASLRGASERRRAA